MAWEIGRDVGRAAAIVRRGGLVAFPTETVYGLGADALDARAVARIFAAKNRPAFDPLIVHISDSGELARLVREVPDVGRLLAERFWPGPLTLVFPKTDLVPDLVTSGLPTVAVRMPDHLVALELLRRAGTPLAAPSANKFGGLSPTRAEDVVEQLGEEIDYVLDGGPCRVGVESTVLSLAEVPAGALPRVLRLGGLALEDIEAAIGPVAHAEAQEEGIAARPSPGMLSRHYAPWTPLRVRSAGERARDGSRRGLLAFQAGPAEGGYAAVEVLSPTGDLVEAAAGLFVALRRLDALGLDGIDAELAPETGLGRAINDRLRRAAVR
jgi:L-threonylcarbamoyladenylate synthase